MLELSRWVPVKCQRCSRRRWISLKEESSAPCQLEGDAVIYWFWFETRLDSNHFELKSDCVFDTRARSDLFKYNFCDWFRSIATRFGECWTIEPKDNYCLIRYRWNQLLEMSANMSKTSIQVSWLSIHVPCLPVGVSVLTTPWVAIDVLLLSLSLFKSLSLVD